MRTNIVLDEALIEKAQKLTGIKTKRAVVDEALRMLIQLYEQAEVRALRGSCVGKATSTRRALHAYQSSRHADGRFDCMDRLLQRCS